ncbi:MAG TPA: ferrous iron transport protein A [Firmicutes bacterium]|nr:ferrous iron transport protein A [Bacillota bacterium]
MPLLFAPKDTDLRILSVRGEAKVNKHLASLGIVEGGLIRLLDDANGAAICLVKESRLGLDHKVSMSIMVAVA